MRRNSKFQIPNYKLLLSEFKNRSEGQIVLMFVLITVVGLTIGLSLISRTISDVRISSQIEQSSRAFTAAEAGVENALKGSALVLKNETGNITLGGGDNAATAKYSVDAIGGNNATLSYPFTQPGEVQTVWLIDHDASGNVLSTGSYPANQPITICFGSVKSSSPAISISLLYNEGGTFKVAKAWYDSDSGRSNGFSLADSATNVCPTGYSHMAILNPSPLLGILGIGSGSTLYALRILVIYEGTSLAIIPSVGNSLPVQGKVITSVGQTSTGVVRKVQVSQGFTVLPSLLDFALFSEK